MTDWLSPEELVSLTGKRRPSAQRRVLSSIQTNYRMRPDGTLLVLRTDLSGRGTSPHRRIGEPNWEAVT